MTERSLPLQEEDTRLYSPVWKTGDIFIVPSAGTTGMRIGCRTPEGIRQQGDRILIPCIDVDWRLEGDLITGPWVVDQYSILLLLLEN